MAQTVIMAGYSIVTLVTFFAEFLLQFPGLGIPSAAGKACLYIFMLFPNFDLAKGFEDVGVKAVCPVNVVDCVKPSPFIWSIIGQKYCFLLLQIPLYYAVVLFIEHKLSPAGSSDQYAAYKDTEKPAGEDHDVVKERERVDANPDNDLVVASHVRKVFPRAQGGSGGRYSRVWRWGVLWPPGSQRRRQDNVPFHPHWRPRPVLGFRCAVWC
jgi:hypothetical protein